MKIDQFGHIVLVGLIWSVQASRIGHNLIHSHDSPSAKSFNLQDHDGNIDDSKDQNALVSLNHGSWHLRHAVTPEDASSADPLSGDAGNALDDESNTNTANNLQAGAPSLSPFPHHSDLDEPPTSMTDLPSSDFTHLSYEAAKFEENGFDETEAKVLDGWDKKTDKACSAALATLHGVTANPTGISACYNIRSFDNSTGEFMGDLCLYRTAEPDDDWVGTDFSEVMLDIVYEHARVKESSTKQKREGTTVSLNAMRTEEVGDMYSRRVDRAPPAKMAVVGLTGTMEGGVLNGTMPETSVRSILTPSLTLRTASTDSAPLSFSLVAEDIVSFVAGLFMDNTTNLSTNKPTNGTADTDHNTPDHLSISTAGVVNLTIVSAWTVLVLLVMGYGNMKRTQARNHYRRRLLNGRSGGPSRFRHF